MARSQLKEREEQLPSWHHAFDHSTWRTARAQSPSPQPSHRCPHIERSLELMCAASLGASPFSRASAGAFTATTSAAAVAPGADLIQNGLAFSELLTRSALGLPGPVTGLFAVV